LFVDDDAGTLRAISAALDPLGARLVAATSAEEALRRMLSEDFAVLLLDVEMPPGMNGIDAARVIHSRERSRSTPIIFMTASDQNSPSTFYQAGAVDVLYKPVDPDILRAKVGVFLELFRLRDQSALLGRLREANTRLTQAIADAEEARARSAEAQNAKDRFLATMSHEIRTPINAILGFTSLLELGLAGPVTDDQRGFLARLTRSSQHLLQLVNDVLDLSKMDSIEMQVGREPLWTGAAVAGALELSEGLANERGVQLVDRKPSDRGVAYIGDEQRVRQILLNLISNAIKFTDRGGTVAVECSLRTDTPLGAQLYGQGPWASVEVQDTGIGISPADQERVFEAFHQIDSGHTRTRGGSGLGLSISRRLARLMGGDITVESTPGKGSTFTLWLPAAAESESAEARSVRAVPAPATPRAKGLCEIGEALRDEVHGIVRNYAHRLRADPETPGAAELRQPELEDHAVTFLADVAQSLIIVGEAEDDAAVLLTDATAIQRTIAERHGLRRRRQRWSEPSIHRDFAVLREEVERAVRARILASSSDTEQALSVVHRLIDNAETISIRAWRRADLRDDSATLHPAE
jgi:signal transduction histidine kinase